MIPIEEEKYYHIYNRGNNNELLFIEKENYLYFLKLVKKYLLPIADIISYCLLPNHFHFIIKTKKKEQLPEKYKTDKIKLHQAFSNLFNAYTKAFNKKYNRKGSLFEKNFKRIEIDSDLYLQNLIIYVNTNPEHHNLSNSKNYKFSSYHEIIHDTQKIIEKDDILRLFDDIENFKFVIENKKINIELLSKHILE